MTTSPRSSVSTTALEMLKTARSGWVRRSDFMADTGAGYGSITRLTRHLVAMGFLERRELLSIKGSMCSSIVCPMLGEVRSHEYRMVQRPAAIDWLVAC